MRTSIINPNDKTAPYYDQVSAPLKSGAVLAQELQLISGLIKNTAKILDIGCGTGRHLIPLQKLGYQITGIESSGGMASELQKKAPNSEIIVDDIFQVKIKQKFDLIIMMWNTFNEIALTRVQALKLLKKCRNHIKPSGLILINIDDINKLQLPNLDFEYTNNDPVTGASYRYTWKVLKYLPRSRITTSREQVITPDRSLSTEIIQRWWSREEIVKLAAASSLKVGHKSIAANSELYLILSYGQ